MPAFLMASTCSHLWRRYRCWYIHTGFRTTCAPNPDNIFFIIKTWLCSGGVWVLKSRPPQSPTENIGCIIQRRIRQRRQGLLDSSNPIYKNLPLKTYLFSMLFSELKYESMRVVNHCILFLFIFYRQLFTSQLFGIGFIIPALTTFVMLSL